ncbi:MAG: lecithin retinol acyltransferase family protein [Desulfovibrionaceae bacterium]|nr:lecithin retinol acyltransferase family protein [Desulfovibrionaceae bacterium]
MTLFDTLSNILEKNKKDIHITIEPEPSFQKSDKSQIFSEISDEAIDWILSNFLNKKRDLPSDIWEDQKEIQPGDVLAVQRFGYQHYGIYIGNSCVIHYASPDISEKLERIKETIGKESNGLFAYLNEDLKKFAEFEEKRQSLSKADEQFFEILEKELDIYSYIKNEFSKYPDAPSVLEFFDKLQYMHSFGKNRIIITKYDEFELDCSVSKLIFPKTYGEPKKVPVPDFSFSPNLHTEQLWLLSLLVKKFLYTLYSPEETVRRAKSRYGEDQYNLMFNNCEHYALWCKTGIAESHQVNKILRILLETVVVTSRHLTHKGLDSSKA